MAAAVRGMHQRMQQIDALPFTARVMVMVVVTASIYWRQVFGAAMAGFVQIADCGQHRIHQHREQQHGQRGQAQQLGASAAEAGHRLAW